MKKILYSLMSMSIIAKAAEQTVENIEQSTEEAIQALAKEAMQIPEKVEMGWKDMIMNHWRSLSPMYQYLIIGAFAMIVFWMLYRMMGCGKNGDDGCGCNK